MEPLVEGHIGTSHFVHYKEVVLFSEVLLLWERTHKKTVHSRDAVLVLEGPLSEVPLHRLCMYVHYVVHEYQKFMNIKFLGSLNLM